MYINSSLLQNAHTQARFWPKCLWSITDYLQPPAEMHLSIDKDANTFFFFKYSSGHK